MKARSIPKTVTIDVPEDRSMPELPIGLEGDADLEAIRMLGREVAHHILHYVDDVTSYVFELGGHMKPRPDGSFEKVRCFTHREEQAFVYSLYDQLFEMAENAWVLRPYGDDADGIDDPEVVVGVPRVDPGHPQDH